MDVDTQTEGVQLPFGSISLAWVALKDGVGNQRTVTADLVEPKSYESHEP